MNILLQAAGGGGAMGSSLLMMVAIIAVFYFFMIRPQQKKQKDVQKARNAMKTGDKVVTAGLAKLIPNQEVRLEEGGEA